MNKYQKRCLVAALTYACIAAFVLGVCVGYFYLYAKLNFTFAAVAMGMVAVLFSCGIKIGTLINDYLDFGRAQAFRDRNRTIRHARRDFMAQSK